jgi:hypothetical protein
MSHDIFLSYSTKDTATALTICEALEREGVRVWMAPRDVPPASPWAEAIVKAIRSAQAVVLLLSNNANASKDILGEVNCAAANRVQIVTVRIAETKPSDALGYYIGASQWLDAFPPKPGHNSRNLAKTIRASLLRASSPLPHSSPSPSPFVRPVLVDEPILAVRGPGFAGSSREKTKGAPRPRARLLVWGALAIGASSAAALFLTTANGDPTGNSATVSAALKPLGVSTSSNVSKPMSSGSSAACAPNAIWRLSRATGIGEITGDAQLSPVGQFRVDDQPVNLADVGAIRGNAIGKVRDWFNTEGPTVRCRQIGNTHNYCCDLGSGKSDVSSHLLVEGWAAPPVGVVRN